MRARTRLTIVATTGVVATALLAAPAFASSPGDAPGPAPTAGTGQQAGPGSGPCDGTGAGTQGARGAGRGGAYGLGAANGTGAGDGAGYRAGGPGAGAGTGLTGVASGTLTDAQKTALAGLAEEELLAHDLYTAFAADATTPVFARVSDAQTRHLVQIRVLLDRYDVTDPSVDHSAGNFADPRVQATYDRLLAEGSASADAAYAAARTVESTDVAGLTSAEEGVTAPDVQLVYSHLLTATQRHLTTFGG